MGTPTDDRHRGVYAISVAAELAGTGVQNLRLYEERGLLTPARTSGGTRQYSEHDIAQLRRIGALLAEGLNLAGIAKVLPLEDDNALLRAGAGRNRRRVPSSGSDLSRRPAAGSGPRPPGSPTPRRGR